MVPAERASIPTGLCLGEPSFELGVKLQTRVSFFDLRVSYQRPFICQPPIRASPKQGESASIGDQLTTRSSPVRSVQLLR